MPKIVHLDDPCLLTIEDKRQSLEPAPEANAWRCRCLDIIRKQIAAGFNGILSARQAEVVKLKLSGLSMADVAGLLNISTRSVQEHLRVARKKLREHLESKVGKANRGERCEK